MSVKLALLGFGTVASGLPFLLKENGHKINEAAGSEISIVKILVRNEAEKQRLEDRGYNYQFVTSIEEILNDKDIDIVIELMGRIEPAKTYIMDSLRAGKHVVTANKDLIALHGKEIRLLAEELKLAFYYEAAVAGGIPILRSLANSYTSDKITRVMGVLNGTSNFMMTKMVEEGWSYEQALETAQKLGYAESDPTNDVEGIDAAYKVAILSQFAFVMTLEFSD
ncbi:MAG: homoserine dehydrogenase, partial [Streptococcus parauberis]